MTTEPVSEEDSRGNVVTRAAWFVLLFAWAVLVLLSLRLWRWS